jgi:cell division protein FtsQ
MRRLTDVTITSADRPAPPRGKASRPAPAPNKPPRPRRRRAAPLWWKRLRAALALGSALAALGGGAMWLVRSGAIATAQNLVTERAIQLSLRSGLRVDDVEVEGRKRVAAQDILAALDIKQGDPILGVDLAAARARLAALPGVKSATIERRLPAELHVFITEREPIAIWQNDGKYQLVDRDGLPAGDNIADFPALPLVVGPGAPERAAALLDLLRTEPALMERVKASQFVSGRHWSILMNGPAGDIEVRLPEDEPAAAWHELARLETEQKLLDRKVTMVDMRLADRLVVRVPGGVEQQQPAKSAPNTPGRHKAPGRDA